MLMSTHTLKSIAITALAVVALVMPINAQSQEDCSNTKETVRLERSVVVADLIAWIIARTQWVVQKPPPTICFVTNTQLAEIAYGGKARPNDLSIKALYGFKTHVVYLSGSWNPNDLRDRSYLVHELTHHLQTLNNVEAPCRAKRERMAFDLQFEWLREQGIQDPYEFLDIDELTIRLISECPN